METTILSVHYVLCLFMIVVILLQAGKGADIGAVFGGASQTVFGSRGPATFLNKLTAAVAIMFIATSVWLAHIAKTKTATSVVDKVPVSGEQASPVKAAPAESPAESAAGE